MSKKKAHLRSLAITLICAVALTPVALILLFVSAPVLVAMCAGTVELADFVSGRKLTLENQVASLSPDKKIRFEAAVDGRLSLTDTRTGRLIQAHQISTRDFTRVDPEWSDNQHIHLNIRLRYPAMALAENFDWDTKSNFPERN